MKRLFSIILLILMIISFCSCGKDTSFGGIDLKNIDISENSIVTADIIQQIKDGKKISTFSGESNGYKYEWTVFGSDIEQANAEIKDIDFGVDIGKINDDEIALSFAQKDSFGFPALLSVYLGEVWEIDSATAYQGENAVKSVSVTLINGGSVINIPTDKSLGECVVKSDKLLSATADVLNSSSEDGVIYSSGNASGKDQYLTDPIPAGKPMPVEPENAEINTNKTYTCTFSIECSTILNNLEDLDPEKLEMVPSDGVILAKTTVTFNPGESVFDVLRRVCNENGIHMESSWTPIYNSAYIEGIHNLYEFDCGYESGWMYRVNGWYPNYGCSRYQLKDGDVVEWRYTCKGLGADVGCNWM